MQADNQQKYDERGKGEKYLMEVIPLTTFK